MMSLTLTRSCGADAEGILEALGFELFFIAEDEIDFRHCCEAFRDRSAQHSR